jgi:glycosyltransferase involved in cell wall biosynthesis
MTQGLNDLRTQLLTVAVPTYNGTAHLAEALHSILNQECPPFELLVSDDHSDDETVTMVRDIAGERARLVINPGRLGLAGNWNQCMALSQTSWVTIFHQDDVMLPGHLAWVQERIKQVEREKLKVGLIAGPVRVINEQCHAVPLSVVGPGGISLLMHPRPKFLDLPPAEQQVLGIWWGNPLRCSAVVTNRQAHAEAGGFDPSYRYVVDWEFWYRVCRTRILSWRIDPEPTVLVRWHPASETQRFKTGTDDLDETARLLDMIYERQDHKLSHVRKRWRTSRGGLSRAFLNRAHEALRSGQVELAQKSLSRAWSLSSGKVLRTIATDPRLGVQMTTLGTAPGLAQRWFGPDHERT